MDREKFNKLKKDYDEIEIPDELYFAVRMGIERGKKHMAKNKTKNTYLKAIAGVAAALVILTAGVNVSPAFADALDNIPVVGSLVKVLQFNNGKASGGEITDGTDISGIDTAKDGEFEKIIMKFSQGGNVQENVGAFKVRYDENPYTMTFEIGGARRFSAQENFAKILENKYVKDIYQIITLDDSLIRFVVEFKGPVEYKVEEMKDPASIVISLKEDKDYVEKTSFSLRTESYPYGETLGILEEKFMFDNETRILKDDNGLYFVEINCFDTKDMAEKKLAELGTDTKLFVEERTAVNAPISQKAEEVINEVTENEDSSIETADTAFSVSVTENGDHYYGSLIILEDGLKIYDEDNKVVHQLQYENIELTKTLGEVSFVLTVVEGDNVITIDGVFADFFEALSELVEVK
jgi:hypothetical protein